MKYFIILFILILVGFSGYTIYLVSTYKSPESAKYKTYNELLPDITHCNELEGEEYVKCVMQQ